MKKEKIENIDETLKIEEINEDNFGDSVTTGIIDETISSDSSVTKIDGAVWSTDKNSKSTKQINPEPRKYKVILATPTKFILDVDGNGQSYSMTEKYKDIKSGDEIELPKEGE